MLPTICDVDPRLGTLDQFDELVAKAHERGIGIIVDIVPNHTSDQHRWFQEALAQGPESEAAQRYVFRAGQGGARRIAAYQLAE